MSELNLDLSGYGEWNGGYTILPEGEYHVVVTSADVCVGKYSNRQYIKTVYTICEGPNTRRQIYDSFALWADNSKVARMRFKSFRAACGLNPNVAGSTEELPNREFLCVLKVRNRNDRPDEQENVVSAYKRLSGTRPAPQGIPAPNYAPMSAPRITPPPTVAAPVPPQSVAQGSEATAYAAAPGQGLPW